jgi:hypothetical protein
LATGKLTQLFTHFELIPSNIEMEFRNLYNNLGGGSNIFSNATAEVVDEIGTWVDGKTIKRWVYVDNVGGSWSGSILINFPTVPDSIIWMGAMYKNSAGPIWYSIPNGYTGNFYYSLRYDESLNQVRLNEAVVGAVTYSKLIVYVYYTE